MAGILHVENCAISRFNGGNGAGIQFNPTGAAELFVTDSTISENGVGIFGGGILIQPAGSGSALVALNRATLNRNSNGLVTQGGNTTGAIVVEVRDSSVARSTVHGIFANTDSSPAGIVIDRTTSTLNGGDGIRAFGSGALIHLGNSAVRGNGGGLIVGGGGSISLVSEQSGDRQRTGWRPDRRAHREVGIDMEAGGSTSSERAATAAADLKRRSS